MSTFIHNGGRGIDLCLSWVNAANGEIPAGAVSAGGETFVARFFHDGELLPGKVANGHQYCFAPYGSEEKLSTSYQVLCETCNHGLSGGGGPGYQWVSWSGHTAPDNGLISGSDHGKPLYVARGQVNGTWCSGKYLPEYGRAYVSYGGKEHELHGGFEVLVMSTRSG